MSTLQRSKFYDVVTNAVCAVLAVPNPDAAVRYRHSRERQYLYAAGSPKPKKHTMRATNMAADDIVKKNMDNVRAKCRQMVRNNPNLCGAMGEMKNNVVFKGIHPQVLLGDTDKAIDDARHIEKQWKEWAQAVKLRSKSKQTVGHQWQDGGVFWHFSVSETLLAKGVVPLNLQLLEVDHLDTMKNAVLENGNVIKHGIEYNREGFVVAFWLFEAHPGSSSNMLYGMLFKSKRCDAKFTFLVSDPERASQSLPIPRLASVITTLKDFEEYQDFERLSAKLASAFAVVVKDTNHMEMGGRNLDGTQITNAQGGNIPPVEAYINPGSITLNRP
ncbi:MAG: phage portal protein [Desulfovibrionales bacterium]|nr:phage portal protein [Desulfovibrionales bacterium]